MQDTESSEPGVRGRLMVVDDDEVVRMVTRQLLEHLEFEVVSLASGSEAVAYLTEHPNSIDLALIDARMPQMTGAELSRTLLRIAPSIPVVLCTGAGDDWRTLSSANMVGVLRKPYAMEDLKAALRGVLPTALCA